MENDELNTTISNDVFKKRRVFIEDVITKDVEKVEPCLVKFSNGTIKNKEAIAGKLYCRNSSPFKYKKKERILRVETPHMAYIGKNFGPSAFSKCKERFFLGILDDDKNRMKLVEMSSFLLHPELNSSNTSLLGDLNDGNKNLSKKTSLMETFGGKRGRMKSKKIAEREYSIEDMSSALHEAMDKIKPLDVEAEQQNDVELYNQILPQCDRKAVSIQDVYSVSSIVSDQHLIAFNDIAIQCLDGTFDSSSFSELFNTMITSIKLAAQEESIQARRICIALYTEVLIQILKKHQESNVLKTCPQAICSQVKSYFLSGKNRVQTKLQEDKLVVHVIILVFLNNNYEVQFTMLSQALGIQKDRLLSFLRIVGAIYRKNDERIILKLPLAKVNFDKYKNPKSRKRR